MNRNQVIRVTQLTVAAVAAFTLTGQAEAKSHGNRIIVESPAQLPELAQAPGQAKTLQATGGGRKDLYIEQNKGARLAYIDESEQATCKQEGSVQVDAP